MMKKKFTLIKLAFNTVTGFIQSIIFVQLSRIQANIGVYLIVATVFAIIIMNIPAIALWILEPKGITIPSDVSSSKAFHNDFIPFIIDIQKRSQSTNDIEEISLLYDWRIAVRKVKIFLENFNNVNGMTKSYDEYKIYSEELKAVVKILIEIYEDKSGFKNIISIYNCENMLAETKQIYHILQEMKVSEKLL